MQADSGHVATRIRRVFLHASTSRLSPCREVGIVVGLSGCRVVGPVCEAVNVYRGTEWCSVHWVSHTPALRLGGFRRRRLSEPSAENRDRFAGIFYIVTLNPV